MCQSLHPDLGLQCRAQVDNHLHHYARGPNGPVYWVNTDAKPVEHARPQRTIAGARAVAKAIKDSKREQSAQEAAREPTRLILGPQTGAPQEPVTVPTPVAHFDGETYHPERDHDRLAGQLGRVAEVMSGGEWMTLAQLSEATGDPEASISARLRDLRKGHFGGYEVEARNEGGGVWRYRIVTGQPAVTLRNFD